MNFTNEELMLLSTKNQMQIRRINPQLEARIMESTSWITDTTHKFKDRVYACLNNITTMPNCGCGCGSLVGRVSSKYLPGHGNHCLETIEKAKQTMLQKFGVDNFSKLESQKIISRENSKVYFAKAKQTMIEKYGVDNPFKLDSTKKKIAEYWESHPEEYKQRESKKISKMKLGKFNQIKKRLEDKFEFMVEYDEYKNCSAVYKFKCKTCGTIFDGKIDDGKYPRCLVCNPFITTSGQSEAEHDFEKFLRTVVLSDDLQMHDRTIIHPYELDFVIPSKKIAIEFDGIYWHSEISGNKGRNYHVKKLNNVLSKGYRLLSIYEDEWYTKRRIVMNRVKHILGKSRYVIGGRQLEVQTITSTVAGKFLDKYHIQGKLNTASINIGAFKSNRLVAVMTFGNLRKSLGTDSVEGHYELYRFCTMGSLFSFPGVANKMFKYFQTTFKPIDVKTFADRRWSDGKLYEKLGFTFSHFSTPDYYYTYSKNYVDRFHRSQFQKHMLEKKLKTFDSSLTEWENMQANGWDRLWDCGNYVYTLSSHLTSHV